MAGCLTASTAHPALKVGMLGRMGSHDLAHRSRMPISESTSTWSLEMDNTQDLFADPKIEIIPPNRVRDDRLSKCICCRKSKASCEMDEDGCGICNECLGPGATTCDPISFEDALARLPSGHVLGTFRNQRWSAVTKRSRDDRRVWFWAEELGGNGVVSFNWYMMSGGRSVLRPCEMSTSKVMAFVLEFSPDA